VALPVVSGRQAIKALTKSRLSSCWKKGEPYKAEEKVNDRVFVVIVPDHAELARGTLKSILRQANITSEEFLKLLQEV